MAEMSESVDASSGRLTNPPEAESSPNESVVRWPVAQRVLFRFLFVYLALDIVSALDGLLPSAAHERVGLLLGWISALTTSLATFAARDLLRAAEPATWWAGGGGGDSVMEWASMVAFAILALAVTCVWSLLDRRRRSYSRLHQWLRLFVRFYLGKTLFTYGVAKVVGLQFASNMTFHRLLTPVGDLAPATVMWTFMGTSFPYTAFVGICEILAGVLVLVPRMTLLGALLGTAIMTNVVVMDFAYDVPVRGMALHLLFMAAFLIAPDARRLLNVVVLNRRVDPTVRRPLFRRPWQNTASFGFVAVYLTWLLVDDYRGIRQMADQGPVNILSGIYEVDTFSVTGDAAVGNGHQTEWRCVAIERSGFATIWLPNGRVESFLTQADPARRAVVFVRPRDSFDPRFNPYYHFSEILQGAIDRVSAADPTRRYTLSYDQPESERLVLEGRLGLNDLRVVLRRVDVSRLLLTSWKPNLVNRRSFPSTEVEGPYADYVALGTCRG
jgi:uncharacterized membrane protein YphA (DoxX/SURF4 family)